MHIKSLELINNVLDRDFSSAKTTFKQIFYKKSLDALADKKIQVAKSIYNEKEEINEGTDAQIKKTYQKMEKLNVPKLQEYAQKIGVTSEHLKAAHTNKEQLIDAIMYQKFKDADWLQIVL